MAGSTYPHVVFAGEEAALDKAAVEALVRDALAADDPEIEDKPLQLLLTLGTFVLTIWFDDEADQVSERYVPYLPPTARRRRLLACTTMLDISGSDDPDGSHAGAVTRLAEALAGRPGVFVFDETRKRFVGLDYGDETIDAESAPDPGSVTAAEPHPEATEPPAPVTPAEPFPVPGPEPVVAFQPEPVPEPDQVPAAGPEPAILSAPPPTEQEPAPEEQAPEPAQVPPAQMPAFEPVPGPEATAGPAIPVPPQAEPVPGETGGPEPHEPRPLDGAPEPALVDLPDVSAPAPVPGDQTQPVTGPPPAPAADRAMEAAAATPSQDVVDEAPDDAAGADDTGRRPGAFRRMLERRRERKRNR